VGEVAEGSLTALAVILTLISAWIQMLGGRSFDELLKWNLNIFGAKSNRIYYRLLAPIFFSCSIITLSLISGSFGWYFLLFCPLYVVISTSGHHSFLRRLVECWCYGLPGVLILFTYQDVLMLWTLQMLVLCPLAAVIGHFCRDKKAPVIELIVNFLRVLLIPIMVV
jgi:hypothetical protein